MHFGKANRVYDPVTNIERLQTTIFIVLLNFPLIPTGTFFFERNRALPDNVTGLDKLTGSSIYFPLSWATLHWTR
jgi:hypothetical protein